MVLYPGLLDGDMFTDMFTAKYVPVVVLCCTDLMGHSRDQGWGSLKLRSSISPKAKYSISQKYLLHFLNLIHI